MTPNLARADDARDDAPPGASEEPDYARAHPLTMFGLDALIAGSARLRPERAALADHGEDGCAILAFAELDFAISAFVARLREFDIEPGARVLLCCPPRAQALIAITAIIAAGFEPVLAPLGLPEGALIVAANATQAEALMAPARFAKLDFEQTLLGVAAQCPSIRLLGALSPEPIDGAADFSPQGPRARPRSPPTSVNMISENWTPGDRAMIGAVDASGAPAFLAQGALLATGLDLARKTRQGGAAPIVSLVSPGSFGGLIAGPLAALLSSATLHFLAPFRADAFLRLLDEIGPVRLVAPRAILPDLAKSGLLDNGALLSCTALSQPNDAPLPTLAEGTCPVIEIAGAGASLRISSHVRVDDDARVA